MNVQMILIFVNITVLTLMEVIPVIVNQVTTCCPMDSLALISMNVILTMVVVIKSVLIKLDLITVNVTLDTHLMKMDMDVLVSNKH